MQLTLVLGTALQQVTGVSYRHVDYKSGRSVLALKIGPVRWVKYSPIFESNLAPLNQGQYSPISYGWFGPRAEMGPTVGWNSLLIELFWPKLCSNGSRKGWIRLWPAGLNWHFGAKIDLLNFQWMLTHMESSRDCSRSQRGDNRIRTRNQVEWSSTNRWWGLSQKLELQSSNDILEKCTRSSWKPWNERLECGLREDLIKNNFS